MEDLATKRGAIGAFGVTILLSAFLLFQVQPLVSKAILPWFGGCAAVWTTCMLFFQVVLFAGYVYAHLLQQWLRPRRQVAFHLGLAVVAFLLLPIAPSDYWKPTDESNPTWQILVLLTATVGLPYFALSATSPLVQAWFSQAHPGRSPYRLYSLSNVGSLAALLSYPFVFEPAFKLETQSLLWSGAFVAYAGMCAVLLVGLWRTNKNTAQDDSTNAPRLPSRGDEAANDAASPDAGRPTWLDRFRWMALPACASLMLLAATNHICQDVATVPFLWVMPLSLYLLSFIISFEHDRWYVRSFWAPGTVFALTAVVVADYYRHDASLGLMLELVINFTGLFFTCMVCHGEVARLKPHPRYLTEFYLLISAGGALGGTFVAVVAPWLFSSHVEWRIAVVVSLLLALGLVLTRLLGRRGVVCYVAISPILAAAASYSLVWAFDHAAAVDQKRNFFGVVAVRKDYDDKAKDDKGECEREMRLVNGRILHGCQFINPAKRHWPTSYYGETSGVGRAIQWFQKRGPVRVGAVGLGVGTLAAYAKPGDFFRFYEINSIVEDMARKHFTFLADCRGKCEVVLGDARLSLEREILSEPQQKYNVLVIDAFSGDAIPTHLLTREAFAIYRQRLAPGGVIAVHVSNRYLRLAPVVRTIAQDCGMQVSRIDASGDEERLQSTSDWVLVSEDKTFLEANPSDPKDWGADDFPAPLWTDQYSNLFQILERPRWLPRGN
jgi:hypothetical protein